MRRGRFHERVVVSRGVLSNQALNRREAFGAFNVMMAHLYPQERESVWSEVEDSMRSFETPGGFEVPGECLIGAATN